MLYSLSEFLYHNGLLTKINAVTCLFILGYFATLFDHGLAHPQVVSSLIDLDVACFVT